ncbi:PepSY-associated TM helix domain-containing protein [Zunongwangia sp. F363]|uniref:PepSY-associated TM helix domain-containing protein n=1 Tax=Autumnicola tepida TaxID=3075595 RepID=A0ABU3CCW2_9FLAO|nr:PepSY-associated TM helix domain-containing protein [Zunongwangia sp. F363]MDT0644178.1 PepSY-associated TM helix domain-containing protein [Zunongwangia sp. F363]
MKKKKQHSFKKWIGRLHLWLGLSSGIIVFIVALTGCIFVFHDELKDLAYDWRKVELQHKQFAKPSEIQQKIKQFYPEADASMVVYQNRERPAQVFTNINGVPHQLYFNPYSAELVHVQNLEEDFFSLIEDLHMHLLLPEQTGKQVVGISTIVFVLMLISGIILWWPKKKKHISKNFSIKWNARWRRINYDWHRVTGIYISIIALLIALTGLGICYEWMHESFYAVGNLWQDRPEDQVSETITNSGALNPAAVDSAFLQTKNLMPQSGMLFVWQQSPEKPIVTGAYPESLEFDHQSNFYFHPGSGKLLQSKLYSEKSRGLKLQEMNYGLHTGQYLGLAGKIIAFTVSLFVAGLPVSGCMIWWGRRNKKKKKTAKPVLA